MISDLIRQSERPCMSNHPKADVASSIRLTQFYPWYVVVLLLLAYTLSFVDRQIIALLVEPIRRDLQISDTQFSLLSGLAFASFYTLMGIPLGRWSDRATRKYVIMTGIMFWSLMTIACGLAQKYWQLFLARMGVGFGEAALSPAAYSIIADYFPRHLLGRAISVYNMGIYIGSGLALIIGSLVIEWLSRYDNIHLPLIGEVAHWQMTFILVGLPGFIMVLLMLTLREPVRRATYQADQVNYQPTMVEVWHFLRQHQTLFTRYFVGFAVLTMNSYAIAQWLPEFFRRQHGLPIEQAGYYLGLISLTTGMTGLFTGGWLGDRWIKAGRSDGFLMAACLGGAGALPLAISLPLMPTVNTALIVCAAMNFFLSFPFGIAPAGLQALTPNRMRGQVTAAYMLVVNLLGMGLGPTMVALITDYVFADDQALAYSLMIMSLVSLPVGVICLNAARPLYRAVTLPQV